MSISSARDGLPIVDLTALGRTDADFDRIAHDLDHACCEFGFFYVTGHGIDPVVGAALESLARCFFAWPEEQGLLRPLAEEKLLHFLDRESAGLGLDGGQSIFVDEHGLMRDPLRPGFNFECDNVITSTRQQSYRGS
jgi:hypothetical protein